MVLRLFGFLANTKSGSDRGLTQHRQSQMAAFAPAIG